MYFFCFTSTCTFYQKQTRLGLTRQTIFVRGRVSKLTLINHFIMVCTNFEVSADIAESKVKVEIFFWLKPTPSVVSTKFGVCRIGGEPVAILAQ